MINGLDQTHVDKIELFDLYYVNHDLTLCLLISDHKLHTVRSKDVMCCG
jgi:hypothetical protein